MTWTKALKKRCYDKRHDIICLSTIRFISFFHFPHLLGNQTQHKIRIHTLDATVFGCQKMWEMKVFFSSSYSLIQLQKLHIIITNKSKGQDSAHTETRRESMRMNGSKE